MTDLKQFNFWFVVGSQDLYGEETLRQVSEHARIMADGFAKDPALPGTLVLKPTVLEPRGIQRVFEEANADPSCAGIITWMHTFSPSKMWIAGLAANRKPLLHLHTQFNRDIPWASIDMDFMNLNQSAHGDREHGYIHARMRLPRKVVTGHWEETALRQRMGQWMRAACAFADGRTSTVVRWGDNMREVAVTEGDKVSAQIRFGWQVNGWGLGDLVAKVDAVDPKAADALVEEYRSRYELAADAASSEAAGRAIREQACFELGMKAFLEERQAGAFTTTFQDLHGLPQLPGLAVQRLMEQGYGFGAEGDWKTAMLVRAVKVMATGLPGGTSFMEDYTYHFEPGKEAILGAHMLELCPTIAQGKPRIEVHPLGIGGKADPARLVFDAAPGRAVCATLVDLGDRFRMILSEVESIPIPQPMPKLPVARVLWRPLPNLRDAAESWILAGGAHHSAYSSAVGAEALRDWAEMAGVEFVHIKEGTDPNRLRDELRWSEAYWSSRG
ncbi:MAG: L-arabinose isomerase [Spirochaetia bacterium]|jgi:L-arabinose isomerase|nr:L-arabinose isomerase [Spirochaetia bacterium]